MMLVWVDDIIIAGTNEECLDEVRGELKLKFKMSDFGKLSYFLGKHRVIKICIFRSQMIRLSMSHFTES